MNEPETNRLTAVVLAVMMITSVFAGTFAFSGAVAAAPGEVLYRVNAGGGGVTGADAPEWSGDWQQYQTGNSQTYSTGDSVSLGPSVPSGTPAGVFQSEVYGDQQWTFSENIQAGQPYEVRLYFAEIYATSDEERLFDVAVEGEQVLNDYDIHADVGHDAGVMKSYTVTPSDGAIDVALTTVQDNAKISAVEIVSAGPEPNTLGGPSSVDFGSVLSGESETQTVAVTNLGGDDDASIAIDGVSVDGDDAFSAGSASQTTLAPGESAEIPVTFSPSSADSASATLSIAHSGSNDPLTVSLSGDGASAVDPDFTKSKLDGFSAGNPTAIDVGPDGRFYVSVQSGTVYVLDVERTGDDSYEVVGQFATDAIKQIPNHDDFGEYNAGENDRQITGLTVGGTAENPIVYVSSSDPSIDVGQDDDDTDTNSGTISRLTLSPGSDGVLQSSEVDHDVMVLGLPRSEENHATNGLDLSADGDTLYVAQGGNTNKGAPGDNFGHTPEFALSAAILEIDIAQIESDYQAKNLQSYDGSYPDLEFYYAIPTIQNDDGTDGDDLPFGGNDGINQAKIVEDGPVQVYSPGYRNPYDLVVTTSGQIYAADHGPNGGWGGQPADASGNIVADATSVTNHPNEDGSYSKSDELVKVDEGVYGGHAAPIRANPTGADIYDENGNLVFDITESNSPVPASMVNPVEADYIPPTSGSPDPGAPAGSANTMVDQNGDKVLFGPTGGTAEYTASNFGGAMQGDLLQVELGGSIKRIQLSADGETATNVETVFNTGSQPLGIATVGDDGPFPGVVLTANRGSGDVTIFEPVDYGTDGSGDGQQCTGADDASLDEDGDGYDNADELDAGTDPCSAASTPADFDGDGESNLNDPDDDNDGLDDTEDPFAVDPNNGLDTALPVQYDFSELGLFGESGQGWTGLMTNGQDYQELYDPTEMTVGGAAEVLTVEGVPNGDAYSDTNTQQYGFQFGVDAPDQPFTVETTVSSFPENPENYQSAGLFVGTGDQSNYVKLVAAADGGTGGVQFAKEVDDSFESQGVTSDSAVAGGSPTLRMTVDPTTDPVPNNGVEEFAVTAEYEIDGETTQVDTTAVPASWFDSSDGVAPAVGVISTSNGASAFPATWTDISVDYVNPPANAPPTADAGADVTVEEGQQVTLDGSGSSDPDGDALGYTWTQTAGSPSGLLDMSDGQQAPFIAPDVDGDAVFTFELSVSDGEDSATDTVNVTVEDTDTDGGDGTQTVAEFVAGEDGIVDNAEVQQAINWWATGAAVPGTDGATVDNAQIQQLVNVWATGASVTTPEEETTGSALVEITPDSGNIDQSTYGGDTFQVTNTGEKNITSVSFDLGTSSMPDMVFDPQGTAGDPTGEGLNIASDGGTGIITQPGTGEAFSQPHNGQNADDGYDVMTVEFDDFQSDETATFWVDNDPTSIKGATVGSQEAGPVSGLELARATVTVTYEDGTTQTTQLMGDGSVGGATAVVTGDEAPAPSVGAQGVSLDSSVLDDYHSGATVSQADQTVTVTGQPGETVTLVRVEGELALSNVPNGGYDVEDLEANNAVDVQYYTATLDSNGEATVPVTLTSSADDGDEAGYNYFVAAHGEASGDTGLASNVVVLKYDQDAGDGSDGQSGDVVFAVNAGGSEYTAVDGTVYEADTNFDGGSAFSTGSAGTPSTPEIGNTEDDPLYRTERYGDPFSYDIPVSESGTYEVTLQFAEIYQGVSSNDGDADQIGDRVFSANVEGGEVELDEYDLYADVGALNATEKTYTVEVTDGTLNIDFSASADNAKISAIKVTQTDGSSNGGSGSADFAVTANSGIDASTYGGGSLSIANTGDKQITSVTYDLSTAVLSDVVFDPEGTAGDSGSKGFSPDGGASATGLQGGSFAAPHDGQSGADGYDELTATFDDFDGGETFAFSVDIDPTSIKNAQGTGAAGSVSGLEMTGATVTVEYADGSTQTTALFGDGSDGGAEAAAKTDVAPAPALGVEGVSLDSSALDAQHGAATVSQADQTVTVSGPAGATVSLLHVEGQLELANQADGYELVDYEANTAENVDYQTVQLGTDGEATVDVSLTNTSSSGAEGGYNHFVAAVQDGDGDTGLTSNVVVLKYDESAGDDGSSGAQVLYRVNAGGDTVAAVDAGPEWVGATGAGSTYLASVGPDGGNYAAGADVTVDDTVPSSTPDAVFDTERYGEMTWEFAADAGQEVEVRLYFANSFPGTSDPGDRAFNVSVEGQQVLTQYDPVADVGHATGTMKSFTATEDGDGTVTVTFETGAAEKPEVRAIEILAEDDA
ncbi:malectin domain-containing carbohydrate-binding protein [Halogeometricum luteum]|uniref:Malectin domain-containing carbohydrate-binding protein n=1 Tax=Halogeometricum luteum TaxID=2950537 RepID=A0ABU2G5N4_9EURY|nr:malectin domain-containing carbohydrate-binding protein [Halogeometricum sp. S3BR5-2]MDS0295603.1 malectin domain-containing carbohydrate-binding protein [Halogeometricum sp. S3BR5-2]